jgi:molybdopterin molybdotransferase
VPLIDVATARRLVLEAVRPLETEEVPLGAALDRVLAEALASQEELPPFDSSAMDGYAVIAGPAAELAVVDESRAGHPASRAAAVGEAIAISTGAQLPEGADAIVPVEQAELRNGRVTVPETRPGDHVRRAGEDVRRGEVVLAAGAALGPAELAVAASLGRERLVCGRRPRVAVVVTGDELVEPGLPLGPGQIRDSNATALASQTQRAGAEIAARRVVPDELDATTAALGDALAGADVVCVSGGVSVGPHDHVKPALRSLGVEERFWGVALKPGKPVWFGVAESALVFGLPGNPVSAMVTFQLFVRPALRALTGGRADDARAEAVLGSPVERNPSRDQAIRCRLTFDSGGWRAELTRPEQGSHVLTSMLGADALAIVEAGEGELPAGTRVPVELLR